MANVLLINSVIRETAPPNCTPLGLLYIAAVLEQHGHKCDICDLNGLRWLNNDREYWLKKYHKHYDFIGLSGLIVTYQEQRQALDYIVKNRAAFGDPILVAGGGLPTSAPEFTFRRMPELDVLVIGEGEMTMLELVGDPKPLHEVAGIAYMNHGKLVKTQARELIPDLDALPFPAWDRVPMEPVYVKNPIWGGVVKNSSSINYRMRRSMNMINSRGCPHSCGFCFHYTWGKKYRMRSVKNVIAEMRRLKELYAVDFIGFVDDNTTANRSWTMEFSTRLIEEDLGIHWGCSARVDQVDPVLLTKMKAAGCEWIGFGVESGSPEILKAMNKKADPRMASSAIQMVRGAGMWANATFIAGYPGETRETIAETARFMRENNCLNSMFFATPYPGTELYEQAKGRILEKYDTEDEYIMSLADATDFRVNLSEMSDQELFECRDKAMAGVRF